MIHQNDVIKVVHFLKKNWSSLTESSWVNCVTDPIIKSIQLSHRVLTDPAGQTKPGFKEIFWVIHFQWRYVFKRWDINNISLTSLGPTCGPAHILPCLSFAVSYGLTWGVPIGPNRFCYWSYNFSKFHGYLFPKNII